MKLYHYTSIEHLEQILDDGKIRLSPSNLLRPINPHIVHGELVDETDKYKPVVWFTSVLDFDKAREAGLAGSAVDKTEVAIVIEPTPLEMRCMFHKWDKWAMANYIEGAWFRALKKVAPQWQSFYVTEHPVMISNDTGIIFRPDIFTALRKD